ncbi:AraC family transcriptional regulator [Pseudarthrobacter sp. J75]|uniref:AraC family transcriptional regulator n=1 Tax=unclassified Pseudarthrobacter TaxID=2647000 RepID=UPI002E8218FE|nr:MULTISPECIES: AraC family transcriptional regulator [unclassified Pseudarthrobacter]MEE2521994.1 AraC family transcriptional regulator [Pseudarthrobacter sp. J47]MEE2528919.1 AraC family transcriptional regulator [Pseudarthrobacter sp. J75]MEE2570274.1 AraC family transcriptional regulator [Pseudarthrobacter sp. J64]
MDPLSHFVDGPRARNAFLLEVRMSPPWAIQVADEAPLTVVAVLSGSAWFSQRGGEPVHLVSGCVLVVRDPAPYVISHQPDQQPAYFIGVDQNCTGSNSEDLTQGLGLGLRAWGNDAGGKDSMLVGTYRSSGQVGDLLISSLPPYLVVQEGASPVFELLVREVHRDGLAQASVLDRLLDLLLIGTIESWSRQESGAGSNWLAAEPDPAVQKAIRLIHASPDLPWTVDGLASRVGVSRASLARRFHDRVGRPPIAYLNHWRLAKAADLLADPQHTLTAVARQVGYASPFSFSTAFKKRYGMSPQEYRRKGHGGLPALESLAAVSPVANKLHNS